MADQIRHLPTIKMTCFERLGVKCLTTLKFDGNDFGIELVMNEHTLQVRSIIFNPYQ